MKRRVISALMVALGAMMLTAVSPAPTASATTCILGTCYGGNVKYQSGSKATLTVCKNWGSSACKSGETFTIKKGEFSRKYWFDTDGFYVPYHCNAYVSNSAYTQSQWVKIGDFTTAAVELYCY